MGEVYIVGGVALLVFCIGSLFSIDKFLSDSIQKTDEQIKTALGLINPNSPDLSKTIDRVCSLQRRKKHLYKDIQNTFSLWGFASIILILVSLEPLYNIKYDFFKIIMQSLGLMIAILILCGLCYLARFIIEIRRINKIS